MSTRGRERARRDGHKVPRTRDDKIDNQQEARFLTRHLNSDRVK